MDHGAADHQTHDCEVHQGNECLDHVLEWVDEGPEHEQETRHQPLHHAQRYRLGSAAQPAGEEALKHGLEAVETGHPEHTPMEALELRWGTNAIGASLVSRGGVVSMRQNENGLVGSR